MKKFIPLFGFLLLVFVISAIGSYVTIPEVKSSGGQAWYETLNKPFWQPPAYLFGPVWTMLYIMIAISGFIIWQKLPSRKFSSPVMAPYWLQLLLNFLWSIFFFGMHQPKTALINIILMVIVIGWNITSFIKVSRVAAYLLLPYLLWVCYATSLNMAIVL